MIKEYASAKELIELPFDGKQNWPSSEYRVKVKADALSLPKRQREGTKAWEYQVSAMPEATQIALQLREVRAERAAAQAREAEAQAQSALNPDELWAWWDRRPGSLKAEAQRRLPIVRALAAALDDGQPFGPALRITAAAHSAVSHWLIMALALC